MFFKREKKGYSYNLKNSQLLKIFSTNLLIKYYTHLGYKKTHTNHYFKQQLYGFYNNVAIINPVSTLSKLKITTRFLFSLMLKNLYICFCFNEIPLKEVKKIGFFSHYYLTDTYPHGLLSNYKFATLDERLYTTGNYFPFLPAALFVLNFPIQSSLDLAKEGNKLLIPTFILLDSIANPSFHPYFIPSNLKSAITINFYLNYINALVSQSVSMKKFLFSKLAINRAKRIYKKKLIKFLKPNFLKKYKYNAKKA